MKFKTLLFLCSLLPVIILCAQPKPGEEKPGLIKKSDYAFLRELTHAVLEKARLYPRGPGNNNTGGILIKPGGNYPSFWIRDYAMSLESGLISKKEQEHMLMLTASTQCDQTWITSGGSLVPCGAIADHIRPDDGKPIYFPGTYSYLEQGTGTWGQTPPYDDQFYFVHMIYYFVKTNGGKKILLREVNGIKLIDRLETAFRVPPCHPDNGIVCTTDRFRGVDFGFRDAEVVTGDLCFPSVLKYRASEELAELFDLLENKKKSAQYRTLAGKIKESLPGLFADNRGMLRASTGKSQQGDVWGTALAVYFGMLEGRDLQAACTTLSLAFKNGTLAFKGNIRHVLTTDDFNDKTAWEFSGSSKNTYQNGAYWGTPVGWVCYAIAQVDKSLAKKLAAEYISDLRETDFRKGKGCGGPYECFYPPDYKQNPVYLTSVSCPFGVFKKMYAARLFPK
jgi:hypothetical protein